MTGIIGKETRHFQVAVFCYLNGKSKQDPDWHDSCKCAVDVDRGHGQVTVYETDNQDKALGVAEYLEEYERYASDPDGKVFTRIGEPFDGKVWHWITDR
jgi:hypothetical protein